MYSKVILQLYINDLCRFANVIMEYGNATTLMAKLPVLTFYYPFIFLSQVLLAERFVHSDVTLIVLCQHSHIKLILYNAEKSAS